MTGAPTESDADNGVTPDAASTFEEGAPRVAVEPDENTLIVDLGRRPGHDCLLHPIRNVENPSSKAALPGQPEDG